MQNPIKLITTILLIRSTLTAGPLDCKIYLNDDRLFFNLGDLQKNKNYEIPLEFSLRNGTKRQGELSFNFCTQATKPSPMCRTGTGTFGFLHNQVECIPISELNTKWTFARYEDGEQKGVTAFADNSDQEFEVLPYDLQYTIICAPQNEGVQVSFVDQMFLGGGRSYVKIVIKDQAGCSKDLSKIVNFINDNPWVFAVLFIVFGFFMIFLGYRFFRQCLSVVGFLVGFLGVLLVSLWFWNYKNATSAQIFLVFLISFLVGLLLCWVFYRFTKIAVCGAGGFFGFIIGNIIVGLAQASAGKEFEPWLYWLIVGMAIFAMVTFGYYVHDHCLILSTAVSGSFLFVRGIGNIAGGYPDEESLERKIVNKEWAEFPWQWWVYISAFFILSFAGIIVQYRHRSKKNKLKEEDEDWKKGLVKDSFYN